MQLTWRRRRRGFDGIIARRKERLILAEAVCWYIVLWVWNLGDTIPVEKLSCDKEQKKEEREREPKYILLFTVKRNKRKWERIIVVYSKHAFESI